MRAAESERGCIRRPQHRRRRQVDVYGARQFHPACKQIGCARRQVVGDQALDACTCDLAVRRPQVWRACENRWRNARHGACGRAAEGGVEDLLRQRSVRNLQKCIGVIHFQGSVHSGQDVAVVKNAKAATQDPFVRRAECDTRTRSEIVGVLLNASRQVLEVVAHSQINRESLQKRPMVLYKSSVSRRSESGARSAERLQVFIRSSA